VPSDFTSPKQLSLYANILRNQLFEVQGETRGRQSREVFRYQDQAGPAAVLKERCSRMRILIAEDDTPLATFIAKAFAAEEHTTDVAVNGGQAVELLGSGSFDLLILDLNLPVMSGSEVLRQIRSRDPDLPILILTAADHVTDRVACLDAGADDFLAKPFSFSELSARVRALLRRRSRSAAPALKVDNLELDYMHRTVHRGGREIELTPREFSLLEYFMRNVGRRITRNMIIEDVWKLAPDTATNVVDVYVNYLRRKVDEGEPVKLIRTVRGVGYEFGPLEALTEE
jgi:two-component system copper resistance phosphate regulon response regulator CusR